MALSMSIRNEIDNSNQSLLLSRESLMPHLLAHPELIWANMTANSDVDKSLVQMIMYPRGATIFAAICCVAFIIIGTLGNLITVLALWRCTKLRNNATTAFVMSLSIADLLFCSINMPLTASRYIHEAWILGDTLCTLFPLFFYGNVGVSLLSMTAITINRYILIAHHQRYDRIYQRRNIVLMIAFVWIFSFALLVPPLMKTWGQFGYSPETFSCTILKLDGKSPKKFLFLFGFLLPCIVIILSYSCIYCRIRQSRYNVATHITPPPNGVRLNGKGSNGNRQWTEDLRLTRLMLVIFCTFLFCFLPLMVTNVFDDDTVYPVVHVFASVFSYASSCLNPFLYAVLNRQYRNAYARILCWGRKGIFATNRNTNSVGSQTNSRSNSGKTVATDVYQYNALMKKVQTVANGDMEASKPIIDQ